MKTTLAVTHDPINKNAALVVPPHILSKANGFLPGLGQGERLQGVCQPKAGATPDTASGAPGLSSSIAPPALSQLGAGGAAVDFALSLNRGAAICHDPGAGYRRETTNCNGTANLYAHRDQGEGAHRWMVPSPDCCMEVSCTCPICKARHTRERAGRVSEKFAKLFDYALGKKPSIAALVFTIPDDMRSHVVKKVLGTLRREARRVVSGWLLDTNGFEADRRRHPGWMVAGVDCWHPEGDSAPGVWSPHIHMEVPNLVWHRGRRSWKTLRLMVSKEALLDLHRRWGEVLRRVLGWKGGLESAVVDYAWRSSKQPFKVAHRIKYDFRHFPAWEAHWRQINWWGFLSTRNLPEVGLPGFHEEVERQGERPVGCGCPFCGAQPDFSIPISNPAKATWKHLAPDWVRVAGCVRG